MGLTPMPDPVQTSTPPGSSPGSPTPATRLGRLAPWVPSGVFVLIAVAFVATGYHAGRASWDSRHYHEPAVRLFAEQLPAPDLTDYASATTPGYHLLLSVPVRLGLDSVASMRLLSAAITALFLYVLTRALARRLRGEFAGLLAVGLALPLVASNYTLLPGVFVLPDNLAWMLVLTILLRTLAGRVSPGGLAVSGLLLAALVFTRQIHLWAAGLVWLGAWMAPDPDAERPIWSDLPKRLSRTVLAVVCTLPAFGIAGYFYWLWGGLTPPRFQDEIQRFSLSLPAFLLLEIAVLSVFFVPWLWGPLVRTRLTARTIGVTVGVVVVCLALAIVPETTWSFWEGRASGWWNVVRRLPTIGDHTSVLILLGAPAGGLALLLWGAALGPRSRWVLGLGLLGFAISQTASANVWQRYHEPFLLILMTLAAGEVHTRQVEGGRDARPRLKLAALVALVGFLGVFTGLAVVKGDRDPDKQRPSHFGVVEEENGQESVPETEPAGADGGVTPENPVSGAGPDPSASLSEP